MQKQRKKTEKEERIKAGSNNYKEHELAAAGAALGLVLCCSSSSSLWFFCLLVFSISALQAKTSSALCRHLRFNFILSRAVSLSFLFGISFLFCRRFCCLVFNEANQQIVMMPSSEWQGLFCDACTFRLQTLLSLNLNERKCECGGRCDCELKPAVLFAWRAPLGTQCSVKWIETFISNPKKKQEQNSSNSNNRQKSNVNQTKTASRKPLQTLPTTGRPSQPPRHTKLWMQKWQKVSAFARSCCAFRCDVFGRRTKVCYK